MEAQVEGQVEREPIALDAHLRAAEHLGHEPAARNVDRDSSGLRGEGERGGRDGRVERHPGCDLAR